MLLEMFLGPTYLLSRQRRQLHSRLSWCGLALRLLAVPVVPPVYCKVAKSSFGSSVDFVEFQGLF